MLWLTFYANLCNFKASSRISVCSDINLSDVQTRKYVTVLPLCKGARCRLDPTGYVVTCFLWRYRGVEAHISVPIFAVIQHSKCLTGRLPHLQIRLTRLEDSREENLTIWSSATLVDSDYLTIGPSSRVSRTLPYNEIYVWLYCPHLSQRHILIAASHSMTDKKSRDIGSSQTCERV